MTDRTNELVRIRMRRLRGRNAPLLPLVLDNHSSDSDEDNVNNNRENSSSENEMEYNTDSEDGCLVHNSDPENMIISEDSDLSDIEVAESDNDDDDDFSDALDFSSDDDEQRINDNDSSDGDSDNDGDGDDGDSGDDDNHYDDDFRRKLGLIEWALTRKVTHVTLDALLVVLRRDWQGGATLPKTAKTLLGTLGARYNIRPMVDQNGTMGEFTYCGIQQGLEQCINVAAHATDDIELQFHCDGLSVSNSSRSEVWPILCRVYSKSAKYKPFVVSMYHGKSKPRDNEEYLRDFVGEINDLLRDGIVIEGRRFRVHVQCIIADTPARSFLKCVQGHMGAHGCERCTALGESIENTDDRNDEQGSQTRIRRVPRKKIAFPHVSERERTDESFREFRDIDHHKGPCLLTNIVPHINMVLTFVLDFMHLGFLGIMSKLLEYWFSTSSRFKVNLMQRERINSRLEQIKTQIPQEFHRKIRGITDYTRYKATELKFFLFYAGPIILKNILPDEKYDHFILFHWASRLLWSEKTAQTFVHISREILKLFFVQCQRIYNRSSATMNMHNLNHVADDVVHTGLSLSEITAFPYENYLGIIKRKLRSPYRLLAQLCRRDHEERNLETRAKLIPEIKILKRVGNVIRKLRYRGKYLTSLRPDNMIFLKNNWIMEIQGIDQELNGNIFMRGLRWMPEDSIYHNHGIGIDSANQNMYTLNHEALPTIYRWNLDQVEEKLIRFDVDLEGNGEIRKFVIPLLHQ